jgi:ribosome-binding protein aMBF1 (putative translation factor)
VRQAKSVCFYSLHTNSINLISGLNQSSGGFMDIGKSIKKCLRKQGMTQQELAEKLGISLRRVNKIANSTYANTETVERLSGVFDIKASEFIALGEV